MRRGETGPDLVLGWAIAICTLGFYGLPQFEPRQLHRLAEACLSAVWIGVLLILLFVTEGLGTIIATAMVCVAIMAFFHWVAHDSRYHAEQIRKTKGVQKDEKGGV
jgi:hypothetical protein